MAEEQINLTNAEIRNRIDYSLKILASIFDEKLQSLESNISNLNAKIELLTQRIEFLERSSNTKQISTSNTPPASSKQDSSKPKRTNKESSSLSDALRLIQD